MSRTLSIHGELRVTPPWGAQLTLRARGRDLALELPRRRDLLHAARALRSMRRLASAGSATAFGESVGASRIDLSIQVRGHRMLERTAGGWHLKWKGAVAAILGPAAAPPAAT